VGAQSVKLKIESDEFKKVVCKVKRAGRRKEQRENAGNATHVKQLAASRVRQGAYSMRPNGLTTPGLSTLFQRFKALPLAEYLAYVIDRSSSAISVGDFGSAEAGRFWITIRGAQTAFILFSTFLYLRPVWAANDLQISINGRLEIRISNSKTPV
jgi:hypothetical protein